MDADVKLDLRHPAHKGMVNLTATLADIPPEHRLDAVATFVRACTVHQGRIPARG